MVCTWAYKAIHTQARSEDKKPGPFPSPLVYFVSDSGALTLRSTPLIDPPTSGHRRWPSTTSSSPSRRLSSTQRRRSRSLPLPTSSTFRPSSSTVSTPTSTRTPSPPLALAPSSARPTPPPPPKRGAAAGSAFDDGSNSAQLYRLRLSHTALASRPHFADFHLALLLPLALLPPALLLPASEASPLAPLLPVAFLFVVLLRLVMLPSPRPAHFASALAALFVVTLLSYSPFAGALASLAALPAWRFARAFWLGTDQPRTGLAVLSSSAPARLLLHLAVLVSSAASILRCCGFLDGPEREVELLAMAAGLQLLASRAAVQMYLNEAVFCWYQRLHANRAPDTEYGRAKVFLHNHHLCAVATQFIAPPLLVLSLLALWWVQGKDFFEGVERLDWLVGWSVAMKEASLLAARWVVAVWSAVNVGALVCYKRGWLFVL